MINDNVWYDGAVQCDERERQRTAAVPVPRAGEEKANKRVVMQQATFLRNDDYSYRLFLPDRLTLFAKGSRFSRPEAQSCSQLAHPSTQYVSKQPSRPCTEEGPCQQIGCLVIASPRLLARPLVANRSRPWPTRDLPASSTRPSPGPALRPSSRLATQEVHEPLIGCAQGSEHHLPPAARYACPCSPPAHAPWRLNAAAAVAGQLPSSRAACQAGTTLIHIG